MSIFFVEDFFNTANQLNISYSYIVNEEAQKIFQA